MIIFVLNRRNMTTSGIHLFQMLKPKVGDQEAGALIDYVDISLKENKRDIQEANLRTLVTKEDLANTREELKNDMAKTKEELKADVAKTREDLKDVKSDTIRWMFAFFITMMLTILGLYLKH